MDALQLCATRGVHHLPLFEGGRLIGVVCTCDLEEIALDAPIRSAVRRSPVTLETTASTEDALRRMSEEIVGSVLVTRAGEPVGIVTREDVVLEANGYTVNLHCESCDAVTHLRKGSNALLCGDCRTNAAPASLDEDELGGSG
jgi:signal-transduction protein with cAMP-binding, CBS, and nucleotidyltransferase domain